MPRHLRFAKSERKFLLGAMRTRMQGAHTTANYGKIADRRTLRMAARLALGAWLIYLSVLAPSLATWDGGGMLNAAVSLVQKHNITVQPPFGVPGRGGKLYGIWYPLLSFVAVPFAAAGLFWAPHVHLPAAYVVPVFAILLSTIIAALTVGATYYLARGRLGVGHKRALAAALAYGFGTLALWYSRSFYADPLLTLITVAIMIALFVEEPSGGILALLCGLAILAKPVGVLVGAAVFLYLAYLRKYRAAFIAGVGSAVGSGLYALYDWARFGNVFTTGQPNFWRLHDIPVGLVGLLISPGVGLFVCCPVVILALRKRFDRHSVFIWALTAEFLLLYSLWTGWFGSVWGPRYLMPVIPALVALSVSTKYRRIWLGLALLGLVMQIPTVFGSPERYQDVVAAHGISQESAALHPLLSPTVGMWKSAIEQVREAEHTNLRQFATYRPQATTLADARNFRIVPLWWWMLPLVHVPRAFGIAIALLEVLSGLWIIFKWRTPRRFAAKILLGDSATLARSDPP